MSLLLIVLLAFALAIVAGGFAVHWVWFLLVGVALVAVFDLVAHRR